MNARLFRTKNSESLWLSVDARRHLNNLEQWECVDVDVIQRTPEIIALHIRPGNTYRVSNGYISFLRIRTRISILVGYPELCITVKSLEPATGELIVLLEVSIDGTFNRK